MPQPRRARARAGPAEARFVRRALRPVAAATIAALTASRREAADATDDAHAQTQSWGAYLRRLAASALERAAGVVGAGLREALASLLSAGRQALAAGRTGAAAARWLFARAGFKKWATSLLLAVHRFSCWVRSKWPWDAATQVPFANFLYRLVSDLTLNDYVGVVPAAAVGLGEFAVGAFFTVLNGLVDLAAFLTSGAECDAPPAPGGPRLGGRCAAGLACLATPYEKAIREGSVLSYKQFNLPVTPQIAALLDRHRASFRAFAEGQMAASTRAAVVLELEAQLVPGNDFVLQALAVDTLVWLTRDAQ